MTNPTSNFGWQMPTPTDLVTDLPAEFEVFGQAVDTDFVDLLGGTTGQVLSKTTNTDLDFTWVTPQVGDITAVNVTSPITGGGSAGAVTIGINAATTSVVGAVQLSDSTSTTSSVLASTPTATKAAYDLADTANTAAGAAQTTANAAIPKSTVTTAGDIIYRTATVPVRLGIGTAKQVLAVNSGATAPEWVNPGGMTLLSTTALSGATTTISGISQSYKTLVAFIYGMTNATADGIFRIAPNGITNQSAAVQIQNNGGSNTLTNLGGNTYITSVLALLRTNANNSMTLQINNYTDTSAALKNYTMNGYIRSSTPADAQFFQSGSSDLGAAVTSLVFSNAGGNLSTGTVLLYGVS
jgi:hypothetical protein